MGVNTYRAWLLLIAVLVGLSFTPGHAEAGTTTIAEPTAEPTDGAVLYQADWSHGLDGWQSPPVADRINLTVPGNQPWTDTGVNLLKGSRVTIAAGGKITIGGYTEPPMTPAGNPACTLPDQSASVIDRPNFLAPNLACWSLIARIGSGAAFEIGRGTTFSVGNAGRLYLGVNEHPGYFGDNGGYWTVQLTISSVARKRPLPPPSPSIVLADGITVVGQQQAVDVSTLPKKNVTVMIVFANGAHLIDGPHLSGPTGHYLYTFNIPSGTKGMAQVVAVVNGIGVAESGFTVS